MNALERVASEPDVNGELGRTEAQTPAALEYAKFPTREKNPALLQRKNALKYLQTQRVLATGPSAAREKGAKWFVDADGNVFFPLMIGRKRVELAPGCDAVRFRPIERLPAVINDMIEQLTRGQFDCVLPPPRRRSKKSSSANG